MTSKRKRTSSYSKPAKTRTAKSTSTARILVVDDQEPIREIIGAMLKSTGYEITTAADGVEALEVLDSGQEFDLLLCNLMMPQLDGMGVLEKTKSKYPDMLFVLHTAMHDLGVALSAIRNGAYDYLLVPFEREQLLNVVNRAVECRCLKVENRMLRARLASHVSGRKSTPK